MRFLLKAEFPVEVGNAKAKDGRLAQTIQAILEDQKPEAAYFLASGGNRAAYVFVDLQDVSEIPAYAEPWFLALNAKVDLIPAMNAEDLAKAGAYIDQAVKKFS